MSSFLTCHITRNSLLIVLLVVVITNGGCEGDDNNGPMLGEGDTEGDTEGDPEGDPEEDTEGDTEVPMSDPNDRHWVGGSGDWGGASHWSDQLGGPGGASVPDNGSIVTIEGDVTVSLPPSIEAAGLLCDGATLDATDDVELAVGSGGLDIATCTVPTGNRYLLGVRYTDDGVLDHIQGDVGGTTLAYVDADGHTVTLRPVGDDAPGRDLNVHHINLGSGGTIDVGCGRTPSNCPATTRVEFQTNSNHGCDTPDILGTGTIAVSIEHENNSTCSTALLAVDYTFQGAVYDVTGGGGSGNGVPRLFTFQPGALTLDAPMVLEKTVTVSFGQLTLNSSSLLRVGADQNFGFATARLDGTTIEVDYIRLDDSDGAVIDFTGGGSVTATGQAGAHGTDLFVANSGSDAATCQQQASPCATVTRCIEAANALASPARCLLSRGDSFDETGTPPTVTSDLWFGAFGSGSIPVITVDVGARFIASVDSRIYEQIWQTP